MSGRFIFRVLSFAFLLIYIAGCSVRAVPLYDDPSYQRLVALNEKTLTLMAELADGEPVDNYDAVQEEYAALIGGFDAVRTELSARPLPSGGKVVKSILGDACRSEETEADCINPSPYALKKIVGVIERVRRLHKSRDLPAELFQSGQGYKGEYEQLITQLLQFEASLKRT